MVDYKAIAQEYINPDLLEYFDLSVVEQGLSSRVELSVQQGDRFICGHGRSVGVGGLYVQPASSNFRSAILSKALYAKFTGFY
jgi:hypothetical protein